MTVLYLGEGPWSSDEMNPEDLHPVGACLPLQQCIMATFDTSLNNHTEPWFLREGISVGRVAAVY